MSKRYRIGLIGTGARGETFARTLFAGTPRAELFGVCDIDEDRLQKFCDFCELGDTPRYTDLDAFLAEPKLDAVIITTPDFTHGDVASAALLAGKNIYLEKPLANTLENCQRIIEAQKQSGSTAMIGFNMRESLPHAKMREIIKSGVLGQLVQISGLEQLVHWHGASYMRRWHRRTDRSGGLLNHKCSHDLDIMMWMVGHEHRITRVASFGGTNVLTPDKQPATHCHLCPSDIHDACLYKFTKGSMFPVNATPMKKVKDAEVYGNDLCVYSPDKDIVDNQSVLMEWDNGLRGTFNLQMFQSWGMRETRVWGENGFAELRSGVPEPYVRVTDARSGDTTEYRFKPRPGGHSGTDPKMINRFVRIMDQGDPGDAGLVQGMASTIIALKADEARCSGQTVEIPAELFQGGIGKPMGAR